MKIAEDYAIEAMGWLVASHPWASGAYTDVVKAMRTYAAECVREDREKVARYIERRECSCGAHYLFLASDIRALPVETP